MPDLTLKRKICTLYCCTFRPLSYNYPYEGNLSTLWPRAFLRKKSIKKSHEPKQITMVFLGLRHTKLIFAFFLPRYVSLRRIKVNIFWEDLKNVKWSSTFFTFNIVASKENGRLFWIISAFWEYLNFTREYININMVGYQFWVYKIR